MTTATPITEADLPSHPEPHSHAWTEAEKRCILAWGNALVCSAKERAAALCDEQAEFHQDMHNTQAERAAEGCAAAIRIRASSGREGT